jgi:hypothetical protein
MAGNRTLDGEVPAIAVYWHQKYDTTRERDKTICCEIYQIVLCRFLFLFNWKNENQKGRICRITTYLLKWLICGAMLLATSFAAAEDVICQTDIKNMDIILAWPVSPNPTELLGGPLFEKLLEEQREHDAYYGNYYGKYYGKYYGNYGES